MEITFATNTNRSERVCKMLRILRIYHADRRGFSRHSRQAALKKINPSGISHLFSKIPIRFLFSCVPITAIGQGCDGDSPWLIAFFSKGDLSWKSQTQWISLKKAWIVASFSKRPDWQVWASPQPPGLRGWRLHCSHRV